MRTRVLRFRGTERFCDKGITAFTCVEKGGETDFTDAHCDNKVEPKKGTFGHVSIGEATTEKVLVTNEKTKNNTTESTPSILRGTLLTVKIELICKKVTGSVSLKNLPGPPMSVEGKNFILTLSECTVGKPTKCTVKEPITFEGTTTTLVNIKGKAEEEKGTAGTEMGVEAKPTGAAFTSITFQGAECPVANGGKSFPLEGTLIGTGSRGSATSVSASGGTMVFTKEMTEKTLKLGTTAASLESTVTLKMEGGNPISYTTVEP